MNCDNYPPGLYFLPGDEDWGPDELDPEIQAELEALDEQPREDDWLVF